MGKAMAIKGNFIFTKTMDHFDIYEDQFLVAVDGKIKGIFKSLPKVYGDVPVTDYGKRLIIPGFVDLHVHAPQFLQMGLGMNEHLLDWLNAYTFTLEARYRDLDFARRSYQYFVDALVDKGTLHASIFATTSTAATAVLFDLLKEKGIGAYVGKVNMDRNGPDALIESGEASIAGTKYLIERYGKEPLVKPIITPRFAPACSRELLDRLGDLAQAYGVPVQSHIGETQREIEWVGELFPESDHYLDVYRKSRLLRQAVLAHAIYMTPDEMRLMKEHGVLIAHCPDSNINIRSGMMAARKYLDYGLRIGLASDVAGGHSLFMGTAMVRAIQVSKLREMENAAMSPLAFSEAFYMGTKAGGAFFGQTGSFEEGYDFDALVIEDHPMVAETYTIEERLEKFIYCAEVSSIIARYFHGKVLGDLVEKSNN